MKQSSHVGEILAVSAVLTSVPNQDAARARILEKLVELLHAETGSIFVLDDTGEHLVFDNVMGPSGALLKHAVKLKRDEGLAGAVVVSGETEAINDVSSDPRHAQRVNSMTGFSVQSALSVPLKFGADVIGVLQILNKVSEMTAPRWSEDDIATAEGMAHLLALSLRGSRQEKQTQNERGDLLQLLGDVVSLGDPSTSQDHCERVSGIVRGLGARLGMREHEVNELRTAALLHDLGKLGLPIKIPPAEQPLDEATRATIDEHPKLGAELVARLPRYESGVAPAIRHKNEYFDGSGKPDGLAGDAIPLASRILAVADEFEVLTNASAYGQTLAPAEAIEQIATQAGQRFDPKVVEVLRSAFKGGDFRHLEGLSPM